MSDDSSLRASPSAPQVQDVAREPQPLPVPALVAEVERLTRDVGLLLSILQGFQEAVGEDLDPEDAAVVAEIAADQVAARQERTP